MMIPSQPGDARHKAWLCRLLAHLFDDVTLSGHLRFKGGTCAAMLGLIDRFSVDLDFDLLASPEEFGLIRRRMEKIFHTLGLSIKDQSAKVPQYFLRYPSRIRERNTIKIGISFPAVRANRYEARRFDDVDRIITCQTPSTMFANKLVALMDRHEKTQAVAGRDIYDMHQFFEQGLDYETAVIKERSGKDLHSFFQSLLVFIRDQVEDRMIDQDLNFLLPYSRFRAIRATLRQETLVFIQDEIRRIQK